MLVRIVAALVMLPLFFVVIYIFPQIMLVITVSLIAAYAVYEIIWQTGFFLRMFSVAVSLVFVGAIPFLVHFNVKFEFYILIVFLYTLILFSEGILRPKTVTLERISVLFFVSVFVSLFFACVLKIKAMDNGNALIPIPFIGAFVSDTAAYFVGSFLGKHKLCPEISPKKSVEGAVGGLVGGMLGMVIFCLILNSFFEYSYNYFVFAAIGFVLSVVSQIGDLSMSFIKREYNVKDFSNLIPGHGGVLDRFDGVLFALPVAYVVLICVCL